MQVKKSIYMDHFATKFNFDIVKCLLKLVKGGWVKLEHVWIFQIIQNDVMSTTEKKALR